MPPKPGAPGTLDRTAAPTSQVMVGVNTMDLLERETQAKKVFQHSEPLSSVVYTQPATGTGADGGTAAASSHSPAGSVSVVTVNIPRTRSVFTTLPRTAFSTQEVRM